MVRRTISMDAQEKELEGISQTVRDLIAQVEIKMKTVCARAACDGLN